MEILITYQALCLAFCTLIFINYVNTWTPLAVAHSKLPKIFYHCYPLYNLVIHSPNIIWENVSL